ncbi:endonuclease [Nafulsella turpanensis]|uniref:endonuclease n=1 Tax=Nafulsella turpanensis TaxID=1265690 RepID=UPI00034D983E|nr:endonuclease [Nafulsella turpanensis]
MWDILKETDRDPNNPANVKGIYSGFSMDAAKEYDSGNGWNREHVWAKSRGDFGTTQGAGTDLHHIRASDISTNSARNNRNFDEATIQYVDGSGNYQGTTESYTSDTEWIWEPPLQVKGDIARMIFYMATRYEGENGEPDLELVETLQDRLSKEPYHARLSVLVQWHLNDPVDDSERKRHEIIYNYQQNRNPFIDHPEFVCNIWTEACGGSAPANSAPVFASNPTPTATEGQLYTYNISATDADGDALSFSATSIPAWASLSDNGDGSAVLSGTPGSADVGSFNVALAVSDGQLSTEQTYTLSVESAGGDTGDGYATDLLISEYIEGSSYNKGLEVANFTGAALDLSAYDLRKQANGSGDWTTPLKLSGSLAHGEVFVLVHSSAMSSMQAVADISTGSSVMSFNGNDAVGLFKKGVLIDILGAFNDASTYGQDVSLIRKAEAASPSESYLAGEWNSYSQDYVADLGQHHFSGGTSTEPSTCVAPTNLMAANVTTSTADLSWSGPSEASSYEVQYKETAGSSWLSYSTSSAALSLNGLTASTDYEFQVKTVCADGSSAFTASAYFRTADPAVVSYCSSSASNASEEWIARVVFSNIDNSSGSNGGYGDFTGLTANVNSGQSYSITIYPDWAGRTYNEGYRVWIDFNVDGDFSDAGEQVLSQGRTKNTVINGSIQVPAGAISGTTRMRVSMKYNREPGACESFSYGEVEDYTLNISSANARVAAEQQPADAELEEGKSLVQLYPNPARRHLYVEAGLKKKETAILKIINLSGKTVYKAKLKASDQNRRTKIDTRKIAAGVYQLMIIKGNQQDSFRFVVE